MEQIKLLYFTKQEDINFILYNKELKDSFEGIYNEWYKDNPSEIKKANEIFQFYKDNIFSILIVSNKIVAFAIGWKYETFYLISHVRSNFGANFKGGCTKVIDKLINSLWDNINYDFFNKIPIALEVKKNNMQAIGCYIKFGFEDVENYVSKDPTTKWMILIKEKYMKKFLLSKSIKELAQDSHNINNYIPSSLNRIILIQNIQTYLSIP